MDFCIHPQAIHCSPTLKEGEKGGVSFSANSTVTANSPLPPIFKGGDIENPISRK